MLLERQLEPLQLLLVFIPIRGAADSGSFRPSNNVFGALAEDGKDSGDAADDSGTSFPCIPGYGDTSCASFYAGPQSHLHSTGGSVISQPGCSSSNYQGGGTYQGGGGGYQGAPSFFSAYAQHSPPVQQQARSARMLGSNIAADSRALDPGDFR